MEVFVYSQDESPIDPDDPSDPRNYHFTNDAFPGMLVVFKNRPDQDEVTDETSSALSSVLNNLISEFPYIDSFTVMNDILSKVREIRLTISKIKPESRIKGRVH